MHAGLLYGLAALAIGFSATGAAAFTIKPSPLALEPLATPAAMCGRSCNSGGRYFPGPPEVCAQNGLNYCGPSRRGGPPPGAGIVVGPGGVGIGVGGPRRDCRTTTVRRPDGTVITRRDC